MLKLKLGVGLHDLQPQAVLGIMIMYSVFRQFKQKEMVVTSGSDYVESRVVGSLHPKGKAWDTRLPKWRWGGDDRKYLLWHACRDALGYDFDVVLKSDHIHTEWDPKGRVE